MHPNISTAGGGPATGLADSFVQILQNGLTGSFGPNAPTSTGPSQGGGGLFAGFNFPGLSGQGNNQQFNNANPVASTTGVAGTLNDILAGGSGKLGGALGKLIQTQQTNDIAALRSRFGAGGGMSFGTPAAYAESVYRSQAAPQIATQTGALQLQTLLPLLSMITQLSGKGIPQAETFAGPSDFTQFANLLSGTTQGIGNILKANAAGA